MANHRKKGLSVEIDKLTNSIENAYTGEVFDTEITLIEKYNINEIKNTEWVFNWKKEFNDTSKEIFKLTTINNPSIILGLVSIEDKHDHIFMHLIESSGFNKGKLKMYLGIPGNLVAFACKLSFERGYKGYIAFDAKTALIRHYEETLGATHFRGVRMFIQPSSAAKLISKYFKS